MARLSSKQVIERDSNRLTAWLKSPARTRVPEQLSEVVGALGERAFQEEMALRGIRSFGAGHRVDDWDVELSSGELVECKTSFSNRHQSAGRKGATHVAKVWLRVESNAIHLIRITQRTHPDPTPGVDSAIDLRIEPRQIFP